MATMPGREKFRPRAVECFCAQVFPSDWQVQLLVDADPWITLGAKLNRMTAATTADYLLIQDDDDWYSPFRIQRQIDPLVRGGYDYSGTSKIFYHNVDSGDGWIYQGVAKNWIGGMAWTRAIWDKVKFTDVTVGNDTIWQQEVQQAKHGAKVFDLNDPALYIATMHSGNCCPKVGLFKPTWTPARLPEFPKIL